MKSIAMLMTLAAGLGAFAVTASAENAKIDAGARASKARQAVVLSGPRNDFQNGFVAAGASSGKQPAWVIYGSTRQ